MRNILFYILSSLLVMFTACEYNEEHFPELDELTRPVDVKMFDYELTDADYAAIANYATNKSLAATDGVSSELENLKTTRQFSSSLPASKYVPAFLAANWATADNKSAAKVSYNWVDVRPEYLAELASANIYKVSSADYEEVWETDLYPFFTPAKSLSQNVDDILKGAYPEAEVGDIVAVSYNYSASEPITEGLMDIVVDEDFSGIGISVPVDNNGWHTFAEVGTRLWEGRTFSGNVYPQFTAHNAGGEAVAWLISPEIDLAGATNPSFSFDVNLGFFNAYLMQVLISEDYSSGDPTTAIWKDVTHQFGIYSAPSGYTNFYVAGVYDLSAYTDNSFHIAFRYAGDSNNAQTTTYQVDNVQVGNDNTVVKKVAFTEDFASGLGSWSNITVQGSKAWTVSSFSGQFRAVYSAFGTTGEQEGWLVSSGITVPASGASQLKVDMAVGYYNADCLSVLVSEDYTGDVAAATWTDVTDAFSFPASATGYTPVVSAGALTLNAYKGKEIFVAFKYVGNAADDRTTTYQIYDVNVVSYERGEFIPVNPYTTGNYALLSFDGGEWEPYTNAVILSESDYSEMGFSFFSSSNKPEDYVPNYLKKNFPYALEGAMKTVVYLYGSGADLAAEEYVFESGVWTKNLMAEVVTDQFVKSSGSWVWNPSMVINLSPVRNDPFIMSYYQAATDWVWEHIDQAELGASNKGEGYVSSFGNNEYYAGTSAFYNNVDMRVQAARNQYPAGYEGKTDTEVVAMMMERLGVVMGEVLSVLHADARPIEGVEITYTVNVAIFTGTTVSDVTHTIVYKLIGTGQFELVSGPDPIE